MCFKDVKYLFTFVIMSLNERITEIINYSELTSSEFADEIEVQRSNISHISSGRNKPSLDFLIKIKERFPEIQWDWLIYGTGEMTKSDAKEIVETKLKATSLPDLFSLIDDQNFGITESEDQILKENISESNILNQSIPTEKISNSQPLEQNISEKIAQPSANQTNKVKRIVLFYEDGKFESFEQ